MEIHGRAIDKVHEHKELHVQNWKLLQGQGKLQEENNKLKGQIKKLQWALCNLCNQVKKKILFLKTIKQSKNTLFTEQIQIGSCTPVATSISIASQHRKK